MSIKARTLWPTLIDLETWVSRNCPNCRYVNKPRPECGPYDHCNLSAKCLNAHLQDTEIAEGHVSLLFGPAKVTPANDTPQVPFMCQSRKDRRGRPSTEAAAPAPPPPGRHEMLRSHMKDSLVALKKARENMIVKPSAFVYGPALDHLDNAIAVVNAAMNSAIAVLED